MDNLITNGRFNDGVTGWTTSGGGSLSWSQQLGGSARILDVSGAGTTRTIQTLTPPYASRARFQVWVRPDTDAMKESAADGYAKVDIRVVSSGDFLYQSPEIYLAETPATPYSDYHQVHTELNVPNEPIEVRLEVTGAAAGTKICYFDNVGLTLAGYNVWINELTTRLPGASSDQIILELKSTLREFFTKSGFWVEELPPMNIAKDQDIYQLEYTGPLNDYDGYTQNAVPQGNIMGLQNLWVDGTLYPILTLEPKRLPASYRGAYPLAPNRIKLFPTPTVDIENGLRAQVRLNPLSDFYDMPPEITTHFFDEIIDGVLGRLYSQPGKPYTNIVVSQYHLRRFRDGMALARDMARKRYAETDRPWAFPSWA